MMLNDPNVNLYDLLSFKKIRIQKAADFAIEFEECFRPFGQIFKYLYSLDQRQSLTNPIPVDYEYIL
jgi:hypothetical protein